MTTDIQVFWYAANNRVDWMTQGAVLATADNLHTAVLVSLFSDRMAAANDVIPDDTSDPRGWWGDAARQL